MSYTLKDLTTDILNRAGKLENPAGITIQGAASSVQSLIAKKLLDRRSDLLASNELSLSIAAQGCSASLPSGFLAMAEKPWSQDVYTDWMMGTVVSYNNTTGHLVVLITESSGTDTLEDWNICAVPSPGGTSDILGSSETSLAIVAKGANATLTAIPGMGLSTGDPVYILPSEVPATLSPYPNAGIRVLQPNYLGDDEDDKHDISWWGWYGLYGWEWEPPARTPHYYKVVGTTLYIRPYSILPIIINGFYFGLPAAITGNTSVIPWGGLFDEIFREGIIMILSKGIAVPEADPVFTAFLFREFDSVINARMHLLPKTRTSRANFM